MSQTLMEPAATTPRSPVQSDRLDFDALYRASRDDVYAYAAALLRSAELAEEVTAQAFERAYRRRRSFDARRGSPRGWLFGIARNAALDELRRGQRRGQHPPEPSAGRDSDPHDHAVSAEARAAVRAGLLRLSARDRELVALKFFAGLSNAEIAAAVGIGESAAGTALHRAIERLRKAMP